MSNPKSVLVVDDVPDNIHVIKGILQGNYKIKAATSGEKALRIAGKIPPPDLILLDVMMPDLDGYAVTRKLKADPQTAAIPIILITALNGTENKIHGLEVGAEEFLNKPVSKTEQAGKMRGASRE